MKAYTVYYKDECTTYYMKKINDTTGHFIVKDNKTGKNICKFYGNITEDKNDRI